MSTRTRLVGCAALVMMSGCSDRTISEVTPQQGRVEVQDIPVTLERSVDILFVLDDSPSMADKQRNLQANFPQFIDVLSTVEGGLPDVHIGVVTSDMGSRGTRDGAPGAGIGQPGTGGCTGTGDGGTLQVFGAPVTGAYLSDVKQPDGSRLTNYTGDLATVFGQIATGAGAGGCGFEQHLEAMKAALDRNPANAGFLRPEAFLAVVVIADEDDCSFQSSTLLGPESAALGPLQSFRCTRFGVTCDVGGASPATMNQVGTKDQCHPTAGSAYLEDVEGYVAFLRSLKPDPTKLIVAGIMGTTEPVQVELRSPPGGASAQPALARSCSYLGADRQPQVADPPVRLQFLLDQFPGSSTFTTICQQDLTDGLAQIGDLIVDKIGDPCIAGTLADRDPATAGVQPECSVSDVTGRGTASEAETMLPTCDAAPGQASCWRIVDDAARCPATPDKPHTNKLSVDRTAPVPEGTHVVAHCVTGPG